MNYMWIVKPEISGDANLDTHKWDEPKFLHVKVSSKLTNMLEQSVKFNNKYLQNFLAWCFKKTSNGKNIYGQSPIFSPLNKSLF